MARAAASFILSVMALSASFIVAIIVTILVTREMELTDTETDGAEA
jgi:ABC-type proline/glycine betaine transport system permease subunit